jgi:hypothetical protein
VQPTDPYMEDTNIKTRNDTTCENVTETRFKILLFLIRFAGIPVNVKSVSTVNAIYNVTAIVFCYTITAFLHMDTIVRRHQLQDVMNKIRALFVIYSIMWAHMSLRYAA